MPFTTDDVAALVSELGASLAPSQYNAFVDAARAALGNCSGPGAAYRILRDLQRNFFDPPADDPGRYAPRHYRAGQTKLAALPAIGGANSATKQLICGANAARLYRINLKAADKTRIPAYSEDRLACLKNEYELAAKEPSNLRYGYVRRA
jgi:hypothetical protein